MIKVENLFYKYEGKYLFKNFNFKFDDNLLFAVKGESGRGKTTLLNILLGFEIPQNGQILFDNLILNSQNVFEIRKKSAFLPQNFNVHFDTIKELFYSTFALKANKKKMPDDKAVNKIFEHLGLEKELMNKKIDEVSGGQKQRVLLASILLTEKKYIFLDEPTSALDLESAKKLLECLKDTNSTVIVSTHDKTVLNFADKIVDLDKIYKLSDTSEVSDS